VVELARASEEGRAPRAVERRKKDVAVPSRAALPLLDRYAKLSWNGEERLVASVEASQGCKHLCKHCPIVPVYQGRFVAAPRRRSWRTSSSSSLARAARQLRRPRFPQRPDARAAHRPRSAPALADVSFDATIKIEHLLQHQELLPELVACGMIFVTSAVETLNDDVLRLLAKGHTAADVPLALEAVRKAGAELRPTLLP